MSFDHIVLVSQVTLFCSFSKNILCIWKLRNKNRQWLHRRNSQYSCSCICHHKYSFTTSKFGFLDFCTGFHKRVWKCFLHTNKRKISVPVLGRGRKVLCHMTYVWPGFCCFLILLVFIYCIKVLLSLFFVEHFKWVM